MLLGAVLEVATLLVVLVLVLVLVLETTPAA